MDVETLSPQGSGLAQIPQGSVAIRQALPGERIQAKLTRTRRPMAAQLLDLETASPDRMEPRCPHFGPCGGCDLQHLAYPAQTQWKQARLKTIFQEAELGTLPPIQWVSMETPWNYRNKLELTFSRGDSGIGLGFHERSSFQRIVDLQECHLGPPELGVLLQTVREAAAQSGLPSYRPRDHQGFWRFLVVRVSPTRGTLMVLLITAPGERAYVEAVAAACRSRVPSCESFSWGISSKISDVAIPDQMEQIFGPETVEDKMGSIRFQFGPTTFLQPNLPMAAQVYQKIQTEAGLTGKEVVYDLYCGIGLIGLSLASSAAQVIGVESSEASIACADRNAQINGVTNATFFCGKVEEMLKRQALFKAGPAPDVIVLDPPRAGLHPQLPGPLVASEAKTLIYLSCNPLSLARDLGPLLSEKNGYRLESLTGFDFFAQTVHAETLAVLRRG